MTTSDPPSPTVPESCPLISRKQDIALMENGLDIKPSEFGWKASNLCCAEVIFRRAPRGFALSKNLVARIARKAATPNELDYIRAFHDRMRADGKADRLIVRSSSSLENSGANSFAGLFQTVPNVDTFEDLVSAIQFCHSKADTDDVTLYARLRSVAMPDEHLAILVQQQVSVRHSALLQISEDGYLLEAYEGDLSDPIRGSGSPEHVIANSRGDTDVLHSSKCFPTQFLDELDPLARDIKALCTRHPRLKNAVLEIATDGYRLFVLQFSLIREAHTLHSKQHDRDFDVQVTPLAATGPIHGLKGAAMKYFHDSKLFAAPLCVFPPATTLATIKRRVSKSLRDCSGYTVRFSHQAKLGLPRCFVQSPNDIVPWISEHREAGWSTIAHPHIDVVHSFELLLGQDSALLEHVPGMWESDNVLDPDVLILDRARAHVWRCTHSRPARFAQPSGWHVADMPPPNKQDFRVWIDRLLPINKLLRRDFFAMLPVNVHFVEDIDGRWYFLNIRRGFDIRLPVVAQRPAHVVSAVEDLEQWNGHSPILLRFASPRGGERQVLAIARRLPQREGFAIIVDFGLLSHPAMILRELGFHLIPTYLYFGNRLQSPLYEKMNWHVKPRFRSASSEPVGQAEITGCILAGRGNGMEQVHDRKKKRLLSASWLGASFMR